MILFNEILYWVFSRLCIFWRFSSIGFDYVSLLLHFQYKLMGNMLVFFRSKRGLLRQGCALSPYLFVICMNVLSCLIDRAAVEWRIGYHYKCKYSNDALVFRWWPLRLCGWKQTLHPGNIEDIWWFCCNVGTENQFGKVDSVSGWSFGQWQGEYHIAISFFSKTTYGEVSRTTAVNKPLKQTEVWGLNQSRSKCGL